MAVARRTLAIGLLAFALVSCGSSPRPREDSSSATLAREPYPFKVAQLAPGVFAISERSLPIKSVCFLMVGTRRALMLDAGSSKDYDISAVVRSLTSKPVSMIPTHFHFDHIGGLYRFADVWMIDSPTTRRMVQRDGMAVVPNAVSLTPDPSAFAAPFKVSKFVRSGTRVDLGGKTVAIYLAKGHTQEDVLVKNLTDNMVFTGDLITSSNLFIGNIADYNESAEFLDGITDRDTKLFGAHDDPQTKYSRLVTMTRSDLSDILTNLRRIKNHLIEGRSITEWAGVLPFSQPATLYTTGKNVDIIDGAVVDGTPLFYEASAH